MTAIIMWCILLVAFLVIETETFQMLSVWFAIGAAVSAVLAAMEISVFAQVVVFVIVSVLCFIVFRPLALKLLKKNNSMEFNTDSYVGKILEVKEDIDNIKNTGVGVINGVEWSLRTENGQHIQAGELVVVKKIQGVKLIVDMAEGE